VLRSCLIISPANDRRTLKLRWCSHTKLYTEIPVGRFSSIVDMNACLNIVLAARIEAYRRLAAARRYWHLSDLRKRDFVRLSLCLAVVYQLPEKVTSSYRRYILQGVRVGVSRSQARSHSSITTRPLLIGCIVVSRRACVVAARRSVRATTTRQRLRC